MIKEIDDLRAFSNMEQLRCSDLDEFDLQYNFDTDNLCILLQTAYINFQDEKLSTALHRAAKRGYYELVEMLVFYGADPRITDKDGKTPLQVAYDRGIKVYLQNIVEDLASFIAGSCSNYKTEVSPATLLCIIYNGVRPFKDFNDLYARYKKEQKLDVLGKLFSDNDLTCKIIARALAYNLPYDTESWQEWLKLKNLF